MNAHHKIITDKGGRVLENRTKVGKIEVGDVFTFQTLREPMEVLFFYKDKVFDYYPMVFGFNRENNSIIMCTTKYMNIVAKKQTNIKRERRKM